MSGLKVPKDRKPIIKTQLYKQELESPEERPKVKRWEKVYCALYPSVLVYYRKRDSKKPLDVISLNNDFLVRKVKANGKSSGKESSKGLPKELFFVTDFDHINIYFGTSSPDKKRRWVEKLKQVFEHHQQKADELEHMKRRRSSFKSMINQAHTRGSRLVVDGTRLTKRELKDLKKMNVEQEKDLQDVEMMRDSWKQEAMIAKERLDAVKQKRKQEKKRLKKAQRRLNMILEEMNVRGHEREYQAFEAEKQRKKLQKMKKRLNETDMELRDYKNPYFDVIEDPVDSFIGFSDDSSDSNSSYDILDTSKPSGYRSSSSSDSYESIDKSEYPLYESFDQEEESLYDLYKRKYSSQRDGSDSESLYDTDELIYN